MAEWWQEGVLYQIYPRSFADSNGDGTGDLRGIVERLDHLEWLGVDGIWLSPTFPSPNADWGYDVSDYLDVHPDLGTLADLDELIAHADERGIRVLLDLVPNHTSDAHPWFRDRAKRGWYVWADRPNNWLSAFGGPAWTRDDGSGQYYLHNFLPQQPDLNWWSEEVRGAFDEILRFWFDRGVSGFRIDVAHGIVKDRELRDNPPARENDDLVSRRLGQRRVYSMNRPEVHDVFRRWRALADGYDPPRVLVGETYVLDVPAMCAYYGTGSDELHLAFNFAFVHAPFGAGALRAVVEQTERSLPEAAWPVWTASNHDVGRFPSHWCDGDEDRARCALLVLLTLRGTPFLYYGDEIGMLDTPLRDSEMLDPRGRDPGRTPMPWSTDPGAGFTRPGVRPWLPFGDTARNVADQRGDPGSTLSFCRDVIALRRELPALRGGCYASLAAPEGVWAWRRGEDTTVAVNLDGREATVERLTGRILISTRRDREGEDVAGAVRLSPWEGVVVAR